MTIKGLHDFLSKNNLVRETSIDRFSGIKDDGSKFNLGIDVSEFLYKSYYIAKKEAVQNSHFWFCSEDNEWKGFYEKIVDQGVCIGFANYIKYLRSKNINPIFVFDGPSGEEKSKTKQKRDANYAKLIAKFNLLSRDGTITSQDYACSLSKLNKPPKYYKEMTSCICAMSECDFYWADSESDELLAKLNRDGICDAVLSRDADQLAYGSKFWVKSICDGIVTYSSTDLICKCLKMFGGHSQFRAFCIMNGTDYNDNIYGLGVKHNLNVVMRYTDIQSVVNNEEEYELLEWKPAELIFSRDISIPNKNPNVTFEFSMEIKQELANAIIVRH